MLRTGYQIKCPQASGHTGTLSVHEGNLRFMYTPNLYLTFDNPQAVTEALEAVSENDRQLCYVTTPNDEMFTFYEWFKNES